MSVSDVITEIRSIRARLEAIEAKLEAEESKKTKGTHTLGDLRGILKGNSTREEIDASLYRCPPAPEP